MIDRRHPADLDAAVTVRTWDTPGAGSIENYRKEEKPVSLISVENADSKEIDLDRRQVRAKFFGVQVQGSQGGTDTFKVTECANTVILWSRKCGGFLIEFGRDLT